MSIEICSPRLLVAVLLLSGTGCSTTSTELEYARVRSSFVETPGDPLRVEDSVRAGSQFAVTIFTDGGCRSPDGTTVSVAGLTADLTPYDRALVRGACAAPASINSRAVTLTFASAGQAMIRVHGLGLHGDVIMQHEVTILP